jgi:hypothetical protein
MRKLLVLTAVLPLLAGCYHTTVTELPDNQRRVTFVNDSPASFVNTSPIIAEDVTLWAADYACPSGFKVKQEAMDLGSFPHSYSIVVECKPPAVAVVHQ